MAIVKIKYTWKDHTYIRIDWEKTLVNEWEEIEVDEKYRDVLLSNSFKLVVNEEDAENLKKKDAENLKKKSKK